MGVQRDGKIYHRAGLVDSEVMAPILGRFQNEMITSTLSLNKDDPSTLVMSFR